MTEAELLDHLRDRYPRETAGCEWKEFKSLRHSISGSKGEDVISYVSALANMDGGFLVLGVTDDLTRIVGIQEFGDYDASNIRHRILGKCTSLDSEGLQLEAHLTSDTGKTVWVLAIPRHRPRLPVYAHDQAWQRLDDNLVRIRPERLAAILAEPLESKDWSAQIVAEAGLADLDPDALRLARAKYMERNSKANFHGDIDSWTDEVLLDRAKITIGGAITRTALLLLGRPESVHFLAAPVQITWKLIGSENAYEHFSPPFLLTTTDVLHRIRNLTIKLFATNQLIATEVTKYDSRVILEALHNCIAHQDYEKQSRIVVTETVDRLAFESAGAFYDGKPEDYFQGDRTPKRYRNPWLAHAMVNLGMIDTAGLGIHTIMSTQARRFFPLPDYSRSTTQEVVLDIFGQAIDENYTRMLLEHRDLPLGTVILLDRVQKRQAINDDAATLLRRENLIEGRKPNYYVTSHVAKATASRTEYIRNRAFDDEHYKALILSYLEKFGSASRLEIERLILDKLSDALDQDQKRNKVHNLIGAMSRAGVISKVGGKLKGRWVLAAARADA